MRKKLLAMLFAVVMTVGLLPETAFAAGSPAVSNNLGRQVYAYGRWANTVKSYLYENERGGLTRVEYVNGQIVVEDYDSSFRFQSGRTVPMELSIWGGFFAGETHNFLVFGQKNTEEDNNKEVIRVVKYSKDWQRLGQTSLRGANTTVPFDAGSLRFAEYDGELYIRTSHEMYTSRDGLNHQANLTMAVRESDMKLLDSYYAVMNSGVGYVSHSFNQFVIVDQQKRIVTLDHGDAYPRSAVLMVYNTRAGQGKFSGSVSSATIQSFPGAIGANTTGASLGGLAETAGGYAVAYNYDGAGSSDTAANRSVYFAYVDKDSRRVTAAKLSDAGTLPPVLAPTGLNGGYILWNASGANGRNTDALYYASYSDGGSVGEVKKATAPLSDCQPILYNGKVVWYTTNNTAPTFYLLDERGVHNPDPTGSEPPAAVTFTDVPDWCAPAVDWAVDGAITNGMGNNKFAPNDPCTHVQILTFLYRAARGEGAATVDDMVKAVAWAREKGMIGDNFVSDDACTRADAVSYIWQAFDSKSPGAGDSGFTDVSLDADYAAAVVWAVENGITNGFGDTFLPGDTCTRAQIVTFLHRAYVPGVRLTAK